MNRIFANEDSVREDMELPEVIEEFLDEGVAKCVAFNRRGTLLASGCEDGRLIIWDFKTRGPAVKLVGHKAAVTCVGWSKYGKTVFSASSDQTVAQWDVMTGKRLKSIMVKNTISKLSVSRENAEMVCISCAAGPPLLLDFSNESSRPLPLAHIKGELLQYQPGSHDEASNCWGVFNWKGDIMFASAPQGCLVAVCAKSLAILDFVKVGSPAKVLGLELSPKGKFLSVNSSDRVVRIFHVASAEGADRSCRLQLLREAAGLGKILPQGSSLRTQGLLKFHAEVHVKVESMQWKTVGISMDCEHVAAAVMSKSDHHIYIWGINGRLERILEGPPGEGIGTILWHPTQYMLLTVPNVNGRIYIWSRVHTENWSAFAPDFKELDQNTEYVEKEDEFDQNEQHESETDRTLALAEQQEEELDIFTIDEIKEFSSDDEGTEATLEYLPLSAQDIKGAAPEPCPAQLPSGEAMQTVPCGKAEDSGDDFRTPLPKRQRTDLTAGGVCCSMAFSMPPTLS